MALGRAKVPHIGIFDDLGSSLGGAQLVVAHMASVLVQDHDVAIIHSDKGYNLESLSSAFDLDLSRVKERTITGFTESFNIPGASSLLLQRIWSQRILSRPYDLFVYSGHGVPPFSYARRSLVYCHFPHECCPDEGLKTNDRWSRRSPIDQATRGWAYRMLWQLRMKRYTQILANSHFTARWIERRWGREAEVLYPPVDLDVPVLTKRNVIVSVGRFTGKRRTKHQLEQVKAFRQLCSQASANWKLYMIGSCGECREDRDYVKLVQRAAEGLPIIFLVNAERKAVCQVLGEAKLFWHTAGLGVNDEERPQEAEHFGIATIEAMRAGCVPIVINSGGQQEIIEDGVNGFLVRNVDELIQTSIDLVTQNGLVCRISSSAQKRSYNFTREAFEQRLKNITERCLTR